MSFTLYSPMMRFAALAFGLIVSQAQVAHAACDTVPTTVVARANAYVISAAQILVEAGCTVGLEVLRRDYEELQRPSPRRWNPWDANREHFSKDARVPIGDFIQAFNAAHDSYVSEMLDGTVLIRPVAGRAAYLETRPLRGTLQAKGLLIMHATLTAAMERRVLSGGVLASFVGAPGVEIDRGEGVQFSVATDGRTVIEILNDIVTQSAPRGWWVLRSDSLPARVESVGFIHRFGSMTGQAVQLP